MTTIETTPTVAEQINQRINAAIEHKDGVLLDEVVFKKAWGVNTQTKNSRKRIYRAKDGSLYINHRGSRRSVFVYPQMSIVTPDKVVFIYIKFAD